MLSEYEREQFAHIEDELYADKGFLKLTRARASYQMKARSFMALALLTGMGMLIVAVAMGLTFLGVLGFCLMLVGAVTGVRSYGEERPEGLRYSWL